MPAFGLGGGMGWLVRKYGLAADSVRYFDVVTADGEQRRVSNDENSDLFWGLRGGSGSLGIVTGMLAFLSLSNHNIPISIKISL